MELLWLMYAQKRAMGACGTVCIAHSHTHIGMHIRISIFVDIQYYEQKRDQGNSRWDGERTSVCERTKEIKGDDICYINIPHFLIVSIRIYHVWVILSVLEFRDFKYLIQNAPILICVFVCARIIPYLPVENKKFYVVVHFLYLCVLYAHIQFHCGNILLFLSLHEWSNQNISALFVSHEKNFMHTFFRISALYFNIFFFILLCFVLFCFVVYRFSIASLFKSNHTLYT